MSSKLSFLLALLSIFYSGMAQNSSENLAVFERHEFQNENDTLLYRLLRPDSIVEGVSYPLIIFFHGSGERGNDNEITLKHIAPLFLDESNRKKYPAYVLVPQCPSQESWTYPGWYEEPKEPMSTVIALINQFSRQPGIDTTRIYITGLSMGGYATWYLLTRFPNRFAAGIPICGGGDWTRARVFSHVPVWAFHGKKDEVVPVHQTRKMIEALKEAGGNPKYTEYKNVKHNSWENAYQEPTLLEWLFDQRKL